MKTFTLFVHAIRGNCEECCWMVTNKKEYYKVVFSLLMNGYTEIEILDN